MTDPLTPPPSGPNRIKKGTIKALETLRQSQAAQKFRDNLVLTLAVLFLLFAVGLSLIGQGDDQTALNDGTPTATSDVTESTDIALASAESAAPTATLIETPPANLTPLPGSEDPTSEMIGPPVPTDSTVRGTSDPEATNTAAYPVPGEDPSGVGDAPTSGPIPTLPPATGSNTTVPLPTLPPAGGNPRPRTTPTTSSDLPPDEPTSGGYPSPSDDEPAPTNIPVPTDETETDQPFPTSSFPTDEPLPTDDSGTPESETPPPIIRTPDDGATVTPFPTAIPTTPPFEYLRGNVRWTLADSPVQLKRDTLLTSGSSLTIEDGVEVQIPADASLIIDGTLNAANTRFRRQGDGNWRSIVVNDGAQVQLSGIDVQGGGAGGVVLSALGGSTVIEDSTFSNNSGSILSTGTSFDMQRTSISGPAPLSVQIPFDGKLKLIGNRVNNTATDGANGVSISGGSLDSPIEIRENLFRGSSGVNLVAQFNEPVNAVIQCNTFQNGSIGLLIKSLDPTLNTATIAINSNSFLNHQKYGLASDVGLDARNNWWGHPSGPYETVRNANGTGDAIGVNLPFQPWMDSKPACTP